LIECTSITGLTANLLVLCALFQTTMIFTPIFSFI
jgi:hypothetical protein